MSRDDQTSIIERFFAVCSASLCLQRETFHARVKDGTFDEDDAAFLREASRDVIRETHRMEVETAMGERPAPEGMH